MHLEEFDHGEEDEGEEDIDLTENRTKYYPNIPSCAIMISGFVQPFSAYGQRHFAALFLQNKGWGEGCGKGFTSEAIQPFSDPFLVNAFLKELEDNGITYDLQDVQELKLPNIKLPWSE